MALCPVCDASDPHAQRLLAYFAAHGSVQPQHMAEVSEMLGQWLGSLDDGRMREPTLAAQVEAWWSAKAHVSADARRG